MGVRVNKAIGFGVKDFVPPAGFDEAYKRFAETAMPNFATWCAKHRAEVEAMVADPSPAAAPMFGNVHVPVMRKARSRRMSECIVWGNPMSGKHRDRLLLIPPLADEWRRHDDPIDWLEETERYKQRDRMVYLTRSLYPWDKGKPPLVIAAMCLNLGIPDWFPRLQEALCVRWC